MIHVFSAAVGYDVEKSPFFLTLSANPAAVSPGISLTLMTQASKHEPHIERLFLALEWARQFSTEDKLVLSDFRDVVFQNDLAEFPFDRPGIFFESGCYKDEPYNAAWLRRDYGDAFLMSVWNRPITCCGVVTGRQSFIVDYLEFCCRELEHLPSIQHGADTSVHARYVWKNNLTYYQDNERSPVYTVGLKKSIRIGKGIIYNENGDKPFIVHQYDRHIGGLT